MKKKIIAVIAALTLSLTALAACGDSSSSKADDISAASQAADAGETAKDVVETADKLINELAWKDQLNELTQDMYKSIYRIEEGSYKKAKVYVGSGGTTAEEIACFEANDEAGAADIKAKLEKRVESQKKAFENYVPGEMTKLNAAVIVVKGSSVYMCIADEDAKAKEIIG